jgi:hypothetical protein
MENDHVSRATFQFPRRYRLRPRNFEFRLIDGKLIELNTGLLSVLTRGGLAIGQQPPTTSPETRERIYVNGDGTPADDRSQFLLERGMTNYLCVLLCRMRPEPVFGAPPLADRQWWETQLIRFGMPSELRPGSRSGSRDPQATASWDHRKFTTYSPAQWRRAVIRRLSLIFRLPPSDPRLKRMADYFCLARGLGRWRYDPELEQLMLVYHRDETVQRRINILRLFANARSSPALRRAFDSKPFRWHFPSGLGRVVICLPATKHRRGHEAARIRSISDQIRGLWPVLYQRPSSDQRWVAAIVYIGRRYLERPKRLARLALTQDRVACEFGLTRRQLTHVLKQSKDPVFLQRSLDRLERRSSARR